MKLNHSIISEGIYDGNLIYIDKELLSGFKFKPKKYLKYDGIKINKLVILNPILIDSILKRKTKIKLEYYLKFIIEQMDCDDEENPTNLREVLNDLTRYKSLVKNKYSKYLEEKYLKLLLNKISVIENELKTRILYYSNIEKKGKSR